jgi:hypothetical protein
MKAGSLVVFKALNYWLPQEGNNQSMVVEIKGYDNGLQMKRPQRVVGGT